MRDIFEKISEEWLNKNGFIFSESTTGNKLWINHNVIVRKDNSSDHFFILLNHGRKIILDTVLEIIYLLKVFNSKLNG